MNTLIRIVLTLCATTLLALWTAGATSITSAGTGAWSDSTKWTGGVPPGPADTVIIQPVDTITVDISATCAGLVVNGVFQTSKTALVDLTINGDLIVNTGAIFKVQTATAPFTGPHTLAISGNITSSGIVFDLRSGSAGSTLGVINTTFAGSSNSTVTINGAYSSTNGDFNAVTFNKTGGARVILGSNMYVSGGSSTGPATMNSLVTFINGIVETGNFTFVAQTSTAANVIGASSASYVLGAMGRGLSNSAGSSKDFPVGDTSGYRPFGLRSTTPGVATGHHAIVRLITGDANTGSSVLNGGIDRVSAVRYYMVTYNKVVAGADSMAFERFYPTYGTDDGVAVGNTYLRVAYSTDSRATWTSLGQNRYPHTTNLTSPPTQIKPDTLYPPFMLHNGLDAMYFALADSLGGPNSLQRSTIITAAAGTGGTISPGGTVGVVLGANQTFTITPSSFYSVDSLLVDEVLVDSTTSYTFVNVTTTHTIRAVFRINTTTTIGVSLAGAWNLISNPVTNPTTGDSLRQLYPTSSSPYAFEFSGGAGYVQRYTLANGKGYWEKFPAAISQPITGTPRTLDTITVSAGWNIVGTISCTVDTGTIVSIPTGLRASDWFAYATGYSSATQLVPGQGYWVKANGPGQFVLSCPSLGAQSAEASNAGMGDELNSLTITDSKGGSQTLYFGADGNNRSPVGMYAMPPKPPVGAFDARFETAEGGSMVLTNEAQKPGGAEFPVTIQSDAYPVTIAWKANNATASYELTDGIGGREFPPKSIQGEGSVTISNSAVTKLFVKSTGDGKLPKEFALSQNYPNPFNPTTNIKFEVPSSKLVTLKVYDVLGREVATLVNEVQNPGYKSVQWDATGVASGVYFYQLHAGDFSVSRKLLLLK